MKHAQDLAKKYCDRMGSWKLDWEVLWVFFQVLIDEHNLTIKQLNKALEEAMSEWDI